MGAHRRGTGSHSCPHREALQSPRPRRQQVLQPERGYCGGDKGSLLWDPCLGAWGQVEAGGERSFTPPAPAGTGAQQALGFCPCHSPCQQRQHPQPCPGADPNLFGTQTLLCVTLGAWHNTGGQPSTLPGAGTGVWSISLGRAKQALVPAPSLNHASTASSWQGMLREQQAEPQQWSRAAFKSSLCVLPWCPMGSQVPSRSRALQSPHHSKHKATAQGSAQPGPHQLTPEAHPEIT